MKLNAISRLDPGPGKEHYKNQGNLNMDETLVDMMKLLLVLFS